VVPLPAHNGSSAAAKQNPRQRTQKEEDNTRGAYGTPTANLAARPAERQLRALLRNLRSGNFVHSLVQSAPHDKKLPKKCVRLHAHYHYKIIAQTLNKGRRVYP
jgi:hypothetical protein